MSAGRRGRRSRARGGRGASPRRQGSSSRKPAAFRRRDRCCGIRGCYRIAATALRQRCCGRRSRPGPQRRRRQEGQPFAKLSRYVRRPPVPGKTYPQVKRGSRRPVRRCQEDKCERNNEGHHARPAAQTAHTNGGGSHPHHSQGHLPSLSCLSSTMSAASAPSSGEDSTMPGTPANDGWRSSALNASNGICPLPMCS